MSILVPRFYNTNIVYDDIPANSILTLDSNSYSSISLQDDGILAKSNNTVGLVKPTGLLYGSMNNDVWTLNSIDPPTTGINAADKTLYYSNGKYVWSELSVSSKNIKVDPSNINGKWTNFLINESNNFTSTPASVNNYGIFNSRGNVINLDSKVLGELGFRFFSPSEINETGYITTNLILFNSSVTSVSFPVNYYNILNFHSTKNTNAGNISSNIWNLSFTKGLYNYTTTSNNLPIELNNTFTTTQQLFYNYVIDNTTKDDVYIHYTTTLDIDSVILPPSNSNYWTLIKKSDDSYTSSGYILSDMSKYKLILGISTSFSNIRTDTYYQNIFLCNQYTPVMSNDDLSTLLGYLIIDLKDIDADGKVNINKSLNIDSTIPFNKNTIMLSNDEFKNSIISFRPYYYIDQLNNIRSLHYNDYNDKPLIYDIKSIESIGGDQSIIFTGGKELKSDQYQYVNDKLRLTGNVCVDSNFQNIYTDSQLVMPSYAFTDVTVDKAGNNITITTNNTYCDYKKKNIYFLGDNYIKAFNYYNHKNIAKTNNMIGYFAYNNDLVYTCLRTYNNHLQNRTIILQSGTYKLSDNTIALDTGTETKILQLIEGTNAYYWSNDAIIIEDPHNMFNLSGTNLIYNNNNDFIIPYGTYEIINTRIDKSLTYITPEDNNVHVDYKCYAGDIHHRELMYPTEDDKVSYFIGSNDICLMRGIVRLYSFINTYTGIYNSDGKLQDIYENHPFLFNGDYIINNELLIDNSEKKFETTVWGITYTDNNDNTTTVFKNTDVKWNLLNQFVLDSTKYYYNATNKSIYTKDSNILVVENVNGVSYHEYIEILNSNYYCMHSIYNSIGILCHKLHPLSTYNLSYVNNYIRIKNYAKYKGTNDYNPNDPIVSMSTWYNLFTTSAYDTITSNNNITTSIKNGVITLNLNDLNNTENPRLIVGQRGIYKDNKFLIHYSGNSNNIVYTDEYTDFPFFDVPVEKDIKVLLNPVTKYSNLKYYKTSSVGTTYTLATYVDFKVSLCNINATLTSYVGEYPSIIN